jgi:hypothetical protein
MFKNSTMPAAATPNRNNSVDPFTDDDIQEFDSSQNFKPHHSGNIPNPNRPSIISDDVKFYIERMIDEKVEIRVKNIVKQYVDPLINELKSMIKPGSAKIITKLEVSVKK